MTDLKKVKACFKRLFKEPTTSDPISVEDRIEIITFLERETGQKFTSTKDLKTKVRAFISEREANPDLLETDTIKRRSSELSGANSGNSNKRPRRVLPKIKPIERKNDFEY